MRIVFMGTPAFAAASLKKLIDEKCEIAGVFTQPDKPRGRGMEMRPSAVKQTAIDAGLPVFQPKKMRDGSALEILQGLKPDLIAVVAYGRILPDEILKLPKYGCINVHGSLLPKYRGASPIQSAVLNGDRITGVTTMHIASELDAGDIIYTAETEIGDYETSGELFDRLMLLGADLLYKTIVDIENGTAPRRAQDHSAATFTKPFDKTMCPIDFTKSARMVIKQICALYPWPVATAVIDGLEVKVFEAEVSENTSEKAPGKILSAGKKGIEISCGGGEAVYITQLQMPGKRRMDAQSFLAGHPIKADS